VPHTNEAFKEAAARLLQGRSMREWARLTGISHTRISDMLFGVVPSYRLLERFAGQVVAAGIGITPADLAPLFLAAKLPLPAGWQEATEPDSGAVEACVRLFVTELEANPQKLLPYARQIVDATRVAEERVSYEAAPPSLLTRWREGLRAYQEKYRSLGYTLPVSHALSIGEKFETEQQVEDALEGWLRSLEAMNRNLPRPKELP
jgi:hypothetical protein